MTYMSSYSVTAPFIKPVKDIIKSYSHSVGILTYFPFGKRTNPFRKEENVLNENSMRYFLRTD